MSLLSMPKIPNVLKLLGSSNNEEQQLQEQLDHERTAVVVGPTMASKIQEPADADGQQDHHCHCCATV